MRKIKTGIIEFLQLQGLGNKSRIEQINKIEKMLKRERFKPLAKILNNNMRPNFYAFLMYYDKVKVAKYTDTKKTLKINGKTYKFIYINDLIQKTKIHFTYGEYAKMSNSRGRWSTKLNIFVLLGLVEKLQVEQIPKNERIFNLRASEYLSKKTKEQAVAPFKEKLKQEKNKKQREQIKKRIEQIEKYWKSVCYYYVPKYNKNTFIKANEIAKVMLENHFTQGTFDRFWVDKVFGKEKAQQIFTEYLGRTKELNEREKLIENTIINCVNSYKCITREDIIKKVPLEELKIYHIKPWTKKTEEQYKRDVATQIFRDIIEEVKQKNGLEYKRLNAEEKKKFNKNTSKWYVFRKE